MEATLLDPSLLGGLSPSERAEALAAAAAAQRAEARAEQRAIERAMIQREDERMRERQQQAAEAKAAMATKILNSSSSTDLASKKVVFVPKMKRIKDSQQPFPEKEAPEGNIAISASATVPANGHHQQRKPEPKSDKTFSRSGPSYASSTAGDRASSSWSDKELRAVKATYLGKSSLQEPEGNSGKTNNKDSSSSKHGGKNSKPVRSSKKIMFRFEWDNADDTLDDGDPLYSTVSAATAAQRNSGRHDSHNNSKNNNNRRHPGGGGNNSYKNNNHNDNSSSNTISKTTTNSKKRKNTLDGDDTGPYDSFHTKPIEKMTSRDWRIFRENYEIVVRGGRAPPPLRSFRECPAPGEIPPIHPALLDAIENVMHYKEPTPIQRQAIPIGLQRRDLLGIAETGSGKTCAFGLPVLQYLLHLPQSVLDRVADDGPLALVVAPTRELALQIHGEFQKMLSRQDQIKTCAIVGGQSLTTQAQQLREGVHVVVGTPGRMNECIEMAYLVLNRCCYVVLDEADRMIDMGFAPQMESILDAMGGLLKSDNETEAYQQEQEDLEKLLGPEKALPKHRLTAMFSATMPLEVERIAKRYMRHPAVISIGDQDSSKNSRIAQRVIFLSSASQKENALRGLLLQPKYLREKVIVFVNEKKHADGVGRMVERIGRQCVVLHGGKSQDQREENLAAFRRGGIVLVATDVAGRGLDIPDVAHVINYDIPSRSIETYTHRIGRTGRAGKEGLATSLITDEDESIMAALKAYLESTGNPVPDRLARHPAANGNSLGNMIH